MQMFFTTLLSFTLAIQEPTSAPEHSPAPKKIEAPPETAIPSSTEEGDKPEPKYVKPRRGPAPSPADFTDVEYEMNSDGTMHRRAVRFGGVINEGLSEPEPKIPAYEPDPSYTPPVHSKVSSINAPSENTADAPTQSTESPTTLDASLAAPLVCAAILGGLFVTGFLFGLLTKPATATKPIEEGLQEVEDLN